jgi:hypothetical protein
MAQKNIPCRYFKGGRGFCNNGDSCGFSHKKDLDDSNLEEPRRPMARPNMSAYDNNIHISQSNIEQKQKVRSTHILVILYCHEFYM